MRTYGDACGITRALDLIGERWALPVVRRLGPPAAATVYELTAWGAQLEPILLQLGRWAAHTPVDLREQAFSVSSFALSLRTTFDADTAGEVELHLWFVIGEEILDARIQRGDFQIQRLPQSPDPPPHSPDRPPRHRAALTANPMLPPWTASSGR